MSKFSSARKMTGLSSLLKPEKHLIYKEISLESATANSLEGRRETLYTSPLPKKLRDCPSYIEIIFDGKIRYFYYHISARIYQRSNNCPRS